MQISICIYSCGRVIPLFHLGDLVLSAGGVYEPVLAFMHSAKSTIMATFIDLSLSNGRNILVASQIEQNCLWGSPAW